MKVNLKGGEQAAKVDIAALEAVTAYIAKREDQFGSPSEQSDIETLKETLEQVIEDNEVVDHELVAIKAQVLLKALETEEDLSKELGWFFQTIKPIIEMSLIINPHTTFDEDGIPNPYNYVDGGMMTVSDELSSAYADWYCELFPF
jgi:hypothetical protein